MEKSGQMNDIIESLKARIVNGTVENKYADIPYDQVLHLATILLDNRDSYSEDTIKRFKELSNLTLEKYKARARAQKKILCKHYFLRSSR